MSTGKPRDLSKEQFWRRMVSLWQESGCSVRAFCDRHGFSQPSFYAWRRRLRQRAGQDLHFVPVRVTADARAATPADPGPSPVELVLGGGRLLRIGPGFDGPTVQRLLALLEEGQL